MSEWLADLLAQSLALAAEKASNDGQLATGQFRIRLPGGDHLQLAISGVDLRLLGEHADGEPPTQDPLPHTTDTEPNSAREPDRAAEIPEPLAQLPAVAHGNPEPSGRPRDTPMRWLGETEPAGLWSPWYPS